MPFGTTPPTPFPLYLLPSLPFRRRRSSASTTSTTPTSPSTSLSSSPSSTHPTSFLSTTSTSHLHCHKCLLPLCTTGQIISKGFTGRHGRAYLVAPPPTSLSSTLHLPPGDLPNTHTHKPVPRQLVTGAHTVSDISCSSCGSVLGWKYVDAEEESQRYKVGKFILETKRCVRGVGWEGDEGTDEEWVVVNGMGGGGKGKGKGKEEEVEFDSQDEDECEDLFSGIWSPQLARRRRKGSVFRREE